MLVRFSLVQTNFVDIQGLINSIAGIATAGAGTTPAKPTGTVDWEILDNTVAGGWTWLTGTQSTSWTAGTSSSYAGNYLGLIAPTPKSGVYKGFELWTNATTTANPFGVCLMRMGQYNGSSITSTTLYGSKVGLGPQAAGSYNGISGNQWLMYGGNYYVSATANYIWIYCQSSTNIFGLGDLTSGASYDYDTKSLHFPVAGVVINGGTGSTNQSYDQYNATVSICNFQRGETGYDYNDIWGTNQQVISVPGITTGSYTKNLEATPFLPVIPAFGTVLADNTTYKSTWNSDGYYRYSVNDISLYNPWQGYPIRTIAGLKIIGWDRYNTTLPPALQNQRIQVGSQKYFCVTTGTGGRSIFGFVQ